MPDPPLTSISGNRNVPVGGDVIKSIIITGDRNTVFVGDYQRLGEAYISPKPVFERVRLDRFVGREWLTAEIDAFLRDQDRGVFRIEAAAGLGKTTYLAHLVKERGYIHHFVEQAPGEGGVVDGLRNLAAQLIRAWEFNAEDVLPGAASRPDYLQRIVFEAAEKRNQVKPGEQIVILVDALDEAGTSAGQNVLGLPRTLPHGVYLIVSHRPVDVSLYVEGPSCLFPLLAEDDANLKDMRHFLEAAATWPGVAMALRPSKPVDTYHTDTQFVETLLDKCRGVWVYLQYVVGEIEGGDRSPLDLDSLPRGVYEYYVQYWQRWRTGDRRDEADWDEETLPLLATLAAAQESSSFSLLCTLAGIADGPRRKRLERLLRETWRPFLAVEEGKEWRYRVYHASLREFLEGRVDMSGLIAAERRLVEELAEATGDLHDRIVERYFETWGGWGPASWFARPASARPRWWLRASSPRGSPRRRRASRGVASSLATRVGVQSTD